MSDYLARPQYRTKRSASVDELMRRVRGNRSLLRFPDRFRAPPALAILGPQASPLRAAGLARVNANSTGMTLAQRFRPDSVYTYRDPSIALNDSARGAARLPQQRHSPEGYARAQRVLGYPRTLSGEERRAINAVTLHHELDELRSTRDPNSVGMVGLGHNDASVILREHQLLSRLSGPGSERARALAQLLRNPRGPVNPLQTEAGQFREAVRRVTGGRGEWGTFGDQKLPAALRDRVLESMRNLSREQARARYAAGDLTGAELMATGVRPPRS